MKSNEEQLIQYLEKALGSGAKEKIEKMLNDQSVDINHFARRAIKEVSK